MKNDEQRLIEACLSVPPDVKTAKVLLEKGVSPNLISDTEYGTSLLFDVSGEYYPDRVEHLPYLNEGLEVMKLLIQHGAKTIDKWGEPIIFEIDWFPDVPCVYEFIKFLLETVSTPFDVWDSPETIYDSVCYDVFNEPDYDFELNKKFLQILVAYGGSHEKGYVRPEVEEEIDLRQLADLEKYTIEFELCEDGYHMHGFIIETATGKRMLEI